MKYIVRHMYPDCKPPDSSFSDFTLELVRVNDEGKEKVIFHDYMEPEDATLNRDLKPLVHELNRLARIIDKLKKEQNNA